MILACVLLVDSFTFVNVWIKAGLFFVARGVLKSNSPPGNRGRGVFFSGDQPAVPSVVAV